MLSVIFMNDFHLRNSNSFINTAFGTMNIEAHARGPYNYYPSSKNPYSQLVITTQWLTQHHYSATFPTGVMKNAAPDIRYILLYIKITGHHNVLDFEWPTSGETGYELHILFFSFIVFILSRKAFYKIILTSEIFPLWRKCLFCLYILQNFY